MSAFSFFFPGLRLQPRSRVSPVTENDLGLKVLYSPPEGIPIKHEIVAVHGIGAHPDHTWCKKIRQDGNEITVNWLADKEMLPAVLPNARIMRFGAKTQWFGPKPVRTNSTEVAKSLLGAIRRDRKNHDSETRPLIFVAHSFGGLVVLQTLLTAANSPAYRDIFTSVTGIAFLGTPFRGAEQTGQKRMTEGAREVFRDVHPGILRITEPNDEMLNELVSGFMEKRAELKNKAQLVCFYELELCDVMAVVGGRTTEPKTIRVDRSSGCLDVAEKIPLQRNHFNMNKFGGPNEETYQIVQEAIVKLADGLNSYSRHDDRHMQRVSSRKRKRGVSPAPRKPHDDNPMGVTETSYSLSSAVVLQNALWVAAVSIPANGNGMDEEIVLRIPDDRFWTFSTPVILDSGGSLQPQSQSSERPHQVPSSPRDENMPRRIALSRSPANLNGARFQISFQDTGSGELTTRQESPLRYPRRSKRLKNMTENSSHRPGPSTKASKTDPTPQGKRSARSKQK